MSAATAAAVGPAPAPGSLDEDAADPPALDEERVQRSAGLRQRMRQRRQRRVHAHRDALGRLHRAGHQLHSIAEVLGQRISMGSIASTPSISAAA